MTAKNRFLNSIITTAKSNDVAMPWTRGQVRRASIARRRGQKLTLVTRSTPVAKSA